MTTPLAADTGITHMTSSALDRPGPPARRIQSAASRDEHALWRTRLLLSCHAWNLRDESYAAIRLRPWSSSGGSHGRHLCMTWDCVYWLH